MAQRSLKWLFVGSVASLLVACGGGGGGGGGGDDETPAPANSGLPDATWDFPQNETTARDLAAQAAWVRLFGPQGAAIVALGRGAVPDAGETADCDGGGTVEWAETNSGIDATFVGCQIGDYTFDGAATVTVGTDNGEVDEYTITFANNALSFTGPDNVDRQLQAGSVGCDEENNQFVCVGIYQNTAWGNNFSYDFGTQTVDGAAGCRCDPTHFVNVIAEDLGEDSGRALVQGSANSSGIATPSPQGGNDWTVILTVDDEDPETYELTNVSPAA